MRDILPEDYCPSENEPYMSEQQLEYFKQRLLNWRVQLIKELDETKKIMKEEEQREVELLDQGALETSRAVMLRTRDRESKLIRKIDEALERIREGTYGYCEETGEEIGIQRLMARPVATLSLEAQQLHERMERRQKKANWE